MCWSCLWETVEPLFSFLDQSALQTIGTDVQGFLLVFGGILCLLYCEQVRMTAGEHARGYESCLSCAWPESSWRVLEGFLLSLMMSQLQKPFVSCAFCAPGRPPPLLLVSQHRSPLFISSSLTHISRSDVCCHQKKLYLGKDSCQLQTLRAGLLRDLPHLMTFF